MASAALALLAIAALALSGCEARTANGHTAGTRVTEEGLVSHLAALNIALEEGLTGDQAAVRVAELAGTDYSREEIEAFTEILRADPERWVRLVQSVDARTSELRAKERARP